MEPISRRSALVLGGLGLAGTIGGGVGLVQLATSGFPIASGAELVEPNELRGANGRLAVRLESAPGPVQIGGREASALSYNGGLPGPTLRVRAGDRLSVNLRNGLDNPTNLHVHGLHVSPEGNGDNMFVTVEPGSSFDYEYELRPDHPSGVYWYHPHHHGFVADQVSGGLYGAIIVEDPEAIEVSRERMLIISDMTLDAFGRIPAPTDVGRMEGREGEIVLVNGQREPRLNARPGERERWRIVNVCVSRYLRLRLDGAQLQLLGFDLGRLETPRNVEEVLLAPGNRADLLVTVGTEKSVLRTLSYDRGDAGGMMGSGSGPGRETRGSSAEAVIALATLFVTGEPAAKAAPIPVAPALRDLRTATVTARRELTFAMGMGGMMGGGDSMMSFTINDREFDVDRVDVTVQSGTVEEWTLTNTSHMDHPFHLHVWPMQIVESDGQSVDSVRWQDVVNVPPRSRVLVRIAFDDFRGRSVYHCHILDHEDQGMMGVIEVL